MEDVFQWERFKIQYIPLLRKENHKGIILEFL